MSSIIFQIFQIFVKYLFDILLDRIYFIFCIGLIVGFLLDLPDNTTPPMIFVGVT